MGGDRKLLRELAKLFLGDAPGVLSRIKRAVANGDARELAIAAHALKGSVGMFSTKGAFEAARTLEDMGKNANLAGGQKVYEALEKEMAQLVKAIGALR